MATSQTRDRARKAGIPATSQAPVRKKAAAVKNAAAKTTRAAVKPAPRQTASAPRAAKATAAKGVAKPPRRRTQAKPARAPDVAERLRSLVLVAIDNLKARDIQEIDVRGKSSVTDLMVIASGTSSRHVKSIADEVVKKAKHAGLPPIGVEGQREGEWVLVDLGDIIVHVMLPRTREFYGLERLWTVGDDEIPAALAG